MKSNQTKILSIGLLFSLLFTISDTIKSASSTSAAAAAAAVEEEDLFEDAIDFAAEEDEEEDEEFEDATELSIKEKVLLKYGINYEDGKLLDIADRINRKILKGQPLGEAIKDQELINFYIAVKLNNFTDEDLIFLNTTENISDILKRFDIEIMKASAITTIGLLNQALQKNVTNDDIDNKHPISIADLKDPLIIYFLKSIPKAKNTKEAVEGIIAELHALRENFSQLRGLEDLSQPELTRKFLQGLKIAPTTLSEDAERIKQGALLHNKQVKTANQRSEEIFQATSDQKAAQERAEQARKVEKAAKEAKEAKEKAAKKARKAEDARITKEARIAKEAEEARSAKIAAIMAENECSEKIAALMVDQKLPFNRARILADLD